MAVWSRAVLAYCDAMRKEVAMMQNHLTGNLRIGAMPSMSPVLPFLLETVRVKYPGVRVDVQFIGNEAMKLGLNNFSLDVALTYLDKADLGRKNTLPIYTEQLSLLVPDRPNFSIAIRSRGRRRRSCRWRCYALRCMSADSSIRCSRARDASPVARVESESILHLMFQVQFTELCTIIPSHFAHAPGLHRGTRALASCRSDRDPGGRSVLGGRRDRPADGQCFRLDRARSSINPVNAQAAGRRLSRGLRRPDCQAEKTGACLSRPPARRHLARRRIHKHYCRRRRIALRKQRRTRAGPHASGFLPRRLIAPHRIKIRLRILRVAGRKPETQRALRPVSTRS